jgi:hypothetical protein
MGKKVRENRDEGRKSGGIPKEYDGKGKGDDMKDDDDSDEENKHTG